MAQAGFTPIQLYRTATAAATPTAGNLADGELAINTEDEKLYFKNAAGTVKLIAANVTPAANGGTGLTSAGTAGNVLTSNGSGWSSDPLPAGGLTYIFTTTPVTATDKQGVLTDTSASSFTVTLPATPSTGAQVVIADAGASWGTNALTVARNGSTIGGLAEDLTCDITGASVQFVYDGTTWEVYAQIGGNGGTAVTLAGVQTLTNKTITYADNTLTGVAGTTATQTLTNKTITDLVFDGDYTEEVFTITDSGSVDLDPSNGTVQVWTLGDNRSPTATGFASGQSMTLLIDDGSAYAITWPSVTWKTDGGDPPTLNTTGNTVIQLWKVSTVLYGARVGDA